MSRQQTAIDLNELRDTVAVVTGAGNNGIGWGLLRHAAGRLGMHVVAIDLHAGLVEAAEQQLAAEFPGVRALGVRCDVTDPEDLARAREAIGAAFPDNRIGALFANAGVIFPHTVLKSTASEWRTTLEVNVVGVVNTLQAFVPLLQGNSAPAIVCPTASVGGLVRGDGGGAAYQASKHAVVALTESLSFELARKSPQLHVHVLCPCIVASALGRSSQINASVARGEIEPEEVTASAISDMTYAMTPDNHARQVFDLIAAGKFYVVTDNVPPYVDHDRPFDAQTIIRERLDNLLAGELDNADAFSGAAVPSAILKGPMFKG
ncbi:MAG: SDR family NAD(P)-dependent oxidoreductase [Pseudomonadota bacterium]